MRDIENLIRICYLKNAIKKMVDNAPAPNEVGSPSPEGNQQMEKVTLW